MISNKISPSNTGIGQPLNSSISSTSVNATVGLEKGQIVRGEVVDLRSNEVSIKLEDGRLLTGKLEESANLSIGEKVAFRIEDVSLKNLILKIIADSQHMVQDFTIDKALEAAGFGKTNQNREIVKELLNQQMSIDKKTVSLLIQQSIQHKDCTINSLVLMNKYHIPVTDANITQFAAYSKGEHSIMHEISVLTNSISDFFHQISNNPDTEQFARSDRLLSILLNTETGKSNNISNEGSLQNSLELQNNYSKLNGICHSLTVENQLSLEDRQTLTQILESFSKSLVSQELLQSIMNRSADIKEITHGLNQILGYSEIGSSLSRTDRIDLLQLLEPFSLTTEVKDQIISGDISTHELLRFIQKISATDYEDVKSGSIMDESLKKLFSSKEFQTIIKEELINKWTFSPKDLTQEGEIDRHFQNLSTQLIQLKESMFQTINGNDPIATQANHLQENIDFMKTLNELFTYIQLPLKLQNQNAHSELYVYSRKKQGRTSADGISVLLHLDLEHLGPLDIHIDLHNNHVVSKFYINSEDSIPLISTHLPVLEHALEQKGYTLNTEIHKRTKDIDIVEDFIKKESPAASIVRYNFDIRA